MNGLITEIKRKFSQTDLEKIKFTFIATFLFGLVAHAYCYLNANFSHDSLVQLYSFNSYQRYFQLGRFIRPLYQTVKCNWALPWVNGLLSLLFFSAAMCFVNNVLRINKKKYIIISCGILVTCSSFSLLNATYISDTDAYSLSFLLVAIGLWVSNNFNKGNLLAIPFYVISLGLYQAYIQVAIFIYIILFISRIINKKDLKESLSLLIKDTITIMASIVIYYAIYRFLLFITNVPEGNEYNSVSQATNNLFFTIKDRLYQTFGSEFSWFVFPNANRQTLILIINIVLAVASIILMITHITKRKLNRLNVIIMLIVLAFTPFAINVIAFISNQSHALTTFSLYFSYLLVIVLLQDAEEICSHNKFKKLSIVCLVAFFLMIGDNCFFSNRVYLQKELVTQNTLSVITRIIDRIEQTEGYEIGKTKVAIVGSLEDSIFNYSKYGSIVYDGLRSRATGLHSNTAITYYETYMAYFEEYLGYPINLLNEIEASKYIENEEVKDMKPFPSSNSCKIIDDVMIVKLSD